MEEYAVSSKPLQPSSKLPKVGKFRSIGVFSTSENVGNAQTYRIVSGEKAPLINQELSSEAKRAGNGCAYLEMSKLFDTLSALKLAYVKLQEAHIPYDPVKIRAADEEVVSLLDSLCTIRNAYKQKLSGQVNRVSPSSSLLLAAIQVQERVLEELQSQAKSKAREAASLRRKLLELEMKNERLAEEIREHEMDFTGLHHSSFENVVKEARKAIHDFTKPLIALMKHSGWDLDRAANAVQESVVYLKRSHKKFAFEAYVSRRMFHGFSPQPVFLKNHTNLNDPTTMEGPQSSFAEFCRAKYMLVVHPKMEESFFGNLDHRNLIANGIRPNTRFYRAFVRMARWVWYLKGLAGFIEPKAQVFGVKQGNEFSGAYMEVVEGLEEYRERCKVEFMVMPGFKLGETVVRSRVYVSRRVLSNGSH